MSLSYVTVFNSHNGMSVRIPKPVRFHNLPTFKQYLVDTFSNHILDRPETIFLLTSFGIKFNFQIINEITEIYLYDKRLFNETKDEAILAQYLQQTEDDLYKLLEPKSIFGLDLHQSKNLFLNEFHSKALIFGHRSKEYADKFIGQINVIFKSFNIILQFIANLIRGTEKSLQSHLNYVKLLNTKSLHNSWRPHYKELRALSPVTFKKNPQLQIRIADYLNKSKLERSATEVSKTLPEMVKVFNGFLASLNDANEEKNSVEKRIELLRKDSIEKFKAFDQKKTFVFSEFELLTKDLDSNKVVLTDDKRAKIITTAEKVYNDLASFANFKETLSSEAVLIFQSIAKMQMSMVGIKTEMKGIMSGNSASESSHSWRESSVHADVLLKVREAENLLSLTVDLPLLFGFMLIEKRRQYEWYDFFSKGVISSILEQITGIIDHEKMFQKLWIKKFGNFIHLLDVHAGMRVQVPSIDLSLVNSDNSYRSDSIFAILGDVEIERDDITVYIDNIRKHGFVNNSKFATLLEKNFKDLVFSTETLKRITKTVSSLSSITSGERNDLSLGVFQGHILEKVGEKSSIEQDLDLNLIKDLRQRIRKLEDLLHQQQYSNLSNWPVIKGPENRSVDNNMSMLFVSPVGKSVTDPIKLLKGKSKVLKDSKNKTPKPLDTSTTIDKHLDNIRLRKENIELASANEQLKYSNDKLNIQIDGLKEALENEQKRNKQLQADYANALAESETRHKTLIDSRSKIIESQAGELKDLKQRYQERTEQISEFHEKYLLMEEKKKSSLAKYETEKNLWNEERVKFQTQLSELQGRYDEVNDESSTNHELAREISDLTAELSDLRTFKTELVSNMQAKETEFSNERSGLEKRISNLEGKLEANVEDYENLMEITQTKQTHFECTTAKAMDTVKRLIFIVLQLMTRNYKFIEEFCFVLESMGLLLVRETDTETGTVESRIKRVKGLKSKKGDTDENDASITRLQHVKSDVFNELGRSMSWTNTVEVQLKTNISVDEDKDSTVNEDDQPISILFSLFDQYFRDSNGALSPFSEFLKMISFEEYDEFDSPVKGMFFLKAISKRFSDVEGFAKKLTKEIKNKNHEKSKLIEATKKKIAVNNFEEGDLVLFLPTQIEQSSVSDSEEFTTPWTAFNIDAPHYFLDIGQKANFGGGEWFVGRITDIESREVTETNVHNKKENPFYLDVGTSWYMVQTT